MSSRKANRNASTPRPKDKIAKLLHIISVLRLDRRIGRCKYLSSWYLWCSSNLIEIGTKTDNNGILSLTIRVCFLFSPDNASFYINWCNEINQFSAKIYYKGVRLHRVCGSRASYHFVCVCMYEHFPWLRLCDLWGSRWHLLHVKMVCL